METEKISYHKEADQFLKVYYENNSSNSTYFMYRLTHSLVTEAKILAKAILLKDMDYQDVMVATWFCPYGLSALTNILREERARLLQDFFVSVKYPMDHRLVVETAINNFAENKNIATRIQQVLSDAMYSELCQPDFIENIICFKDEVNRLTSDNNPELFYLRYYHGLFIKATYSTAYAIEHYSAVRQKNFHLLEKRIRKLEEVQQIADRNTFKMNDPATLTNKETEDLFKIAFRNYNHLVSVADSKASLLINVNSIIISVMLAFVLSKVEKNALLLWPTILLLVISSVTIFLAILASRPQKNIFSEDKNAQNYQRFFFGSFDLIDPRFKQATWENYLGQLNELFTSSKQMVYVELYKETYNVRKVLSKKFSYLSMAYWVFIIGLLFSITAFIIAIQSQKMI